MHSLDLGVLKGTEITLSIGPGSNNGLSMLTLKATSKLGNGCRWTWDMDAGIHTG